jgi:hypothetical protein
VKRLQNLSAPWTPAKDRLPFARLAGAKRFCIEALEGYVQERSA